MAIGPDASNEKFDSSGYFDLMLELITFLDQVRSVAIQDMDVARVDVNVLQERLRELRSKVARASPEP